MKVLLSWKTMISGVWSGGSEYVSDWDSLIMYLTPLKETAGTFGLNFIDGPELGPICMQLESDKKRYLMTLLEVTEDDTSVRAYDNPTASAEMVDILGDSWDARQLTDDFNLVIMLFKEFFEKGDVSHQWLN